MEERDRSPERVPGGRPLRIFVSYRRDDTGGHAGRLYDALAAHFGPGNVFMDIDTIDLGTDFTEAIGRAVASYDVVIALIGRRWLDAADAEGRRRLDDPHDFLRLELETALAHDVYVIPTLVEGTAYPAADRLPPSLEALPARQGIELRDAAWHDDVKRLIRRIERLRASPAEPASKRRRLILGMGLALVVLFAAAAAAAVTVARDGSGSDGENQVTADEQLLAAIRPIIRTSCNAISYGEETAVASVECAGAGAAALYHRFPNGAEMDAWYAQRREEAGIEPGAGTCTENAFRGEEPYRAAGERVGNYVCFVEEGKPKIAGTDHRANVGFELFMVERRGRDAVESLLRQWRCCLQTQA